MSGILLPALLAVAGLILALLTYRGIRRGGARFYTLEREAILRRASMTLFFSVLLFLGSFGMLAYQQNQLTAEEDPAAEQVDGEPSENVEASEGTPTVEFAVEQFPPTETPTVVSNEPTPTPTQVVCRAVVEGTAGNGLTLRTVPGGDEVSVLPDGSVLTVLPTDPVTEGGFVWRQVRVVGGEEGWVAEDFLAVRAPCVLE